MFGMVVGGVAVFISAPSIFNTRATQAYYETQAAELEARGQALSATEVELQNALSQYTGFATQSALDLRLTSISQQNDGQLLQQTATQSAQNIIGTQNALVANNRQQQTQVALDYDSTQAALQQNATQVELNFRATRAALGAPNSQNSQSTAVPNVVTATVSPSLTPRPSTTPQPMLTPQPTSTVAQAQSLATIQPLPFDPLTPTPNTSQLVLSLADGIPNALQASLDGGTAGWERRNNGLSVTQNSAWLITRTLFSDNIMFGVSFQPSITAAADYDLLLNVGGTNALLVRLKTQNLRATQISVYKTNGLPPFNIVGVRPLQEADVELSLGANTSLTALVQDGKLTVLSGERILIDGVDVSFFTTGAIGVQLPRDATLLEFSITP